MQDPSISQPELVNAYIEEDGNSITLLERHADGVKRKRRIRAEYVTWHKQADLSAEMMRQLKGFAIVESVARTKDGFVRVAWRGHWARRDGIDAVRRDGVTSYEGDLDPLSLYLVESKCKIAKPKTCFLDIEADSRVPIGRKLEMRTLSWAVVDRETGEEFSGVLEAEDDASERKLLIELVEVLKRFDQISVWEGDWKGGEFDSVHLPARCQLQRVPFDTREWLWLNQLAVWKRMNMQTADSGAEKESFKLDDVALQQIGKGKEATPAFVVERFGKDRTSRGLGAMSWDLWSEGGEFRKLLLRYNIRDARILRELEQKKGFIVVFEALCGLCGILPRTKSLLPTMQMDGYVLRLGREQGMRFPTKVYRQDNDDDDDKFKGAFVLPPRSVAADPKANAKKGLPPWSDEDARRWRGSLGLKNGIVRNVHVCDFKSLYPSVMRTWNLSADVKVGWCTSKDERPEGVCRSPGNNLATRTDVIGIIPYALGELLRLRKVWSDKKASHIPGTTEWQDANAISNAYKVAANSFYGAGGAKSSRFYDRDVSEATTQNSVHLIKIVIEEAVKRGMADVYGDTDSCFIVGPSEEGFRKFVHWLNTKRLPEEVAKFGCKDNHIKLSFEKTLSHFVPVASKFYASAYLQFEGTRATEDSEPEVKGLAWKRGDKSRRTRELQGRVIDCLVGNLKMKQSDGTKLPINHDTRLVGEGEDMRAFYVSDLETGIGFEVPKRTEDFDVYRSLIERERDYIMVGNLPLEEVRFSKQLSKPLHEYGKDPSEVHARIAKIMIERGQQAAQKMRIEYVIVDASKSPMLAIPAEDYAGEFDRFYLWESVYSPTRDLLQAAFPDYDWDQYSAFRPKKSRSGKKKISEDQLGLGFGLLGRPSKPDEGMRELAVLAYSQKPITIEIPEAAGKDAIDRVKRVLLKHPGARSVEVAIRLNSGILATLRSEIRISPSNKLLEEVEEALKAPLDDA